MELMAMKCPNCSGDIRYTPGKSTAVCPYCDSQIKINVTAEEREFERDRSRLANERPKYMSALKKWRIIFYTSLPLAVLSGALMYFTESSFFALPAVFFIFAASPVIHLAAPEPSEALKKELTKKELPLGKGALYGIFIGLCLLGYLVPALISDDSKPKEDTATSSVEVQAELRN